MSRTFSIVINNYNYARFLKQTIESALSQTYPQVEVVVVDDGSTDESVEIIRSYGDKIRAVLKPNGGQASAFNAGVARSSGEIVAFLDADDYLQPTAVEQIVSHWNDETDILHHRLRTVDSGGQPIGYYPPLPGPLASGDIVPQLVATGAYCCPATTGLVYSRKVLDKVLPIPEDEWRICADAYLCIAAPFFGHVATLEDPVAFYRMHGSNTFGLAHELTRKTLTRANLKRITHHTLQRYALIREMAAERGLPATHFPLNGIRFAELLLYRSEPVSAGYSLIKGGALYESLLELLGSEPDLLFSVRLQKAVVGLLIWLAPRFLLRTIYPRVFAEGGA